MRDVYYSALGLWGIRTVPRRAARRGSCLETKVTRLKPRLAV